MFAQSDAAKNVTVIDFLSKNLFSGDVIATNQSDPSHIYLGMIFGNIAGLVGTSIITDMFRIFNVGVSLALVISVIYVGVSGLSAMPSEGGMIGSGRASPFMIFRTIAGFALVAPTPTGYSLIQKIVMNVVLSGVVVANYSWNHILDSFNIDQNPAQVITTDPDTSTLFSVIGGGPIEIATSTDGRPFQYELLAANSEDLNGFLYKLNHVAANALSVVDSADMIAGTYINAPRFSEVSARADNKIIIEAEIRAGSQLFKKKILEIELKLAQDPTPEDVQNQKELKKAIKFYLLKILNDTSSRYELELLTRGARSKLDQVEINEVNALKRAAMRGFVDSAPREKLEKSVQDSSWKDQAIGWGWLGAGVYYLQFESALTQDQSPAAIEAQEQFWMPAGGIVLTNYAWIKPDKLSNASSCDEGRTGLPSVNCLKRAKIDNSIVPIWLNSYVLGEEPPVSQSRAPNSRAAYILGKLNRNPDYVKNFPEIKIAGFDVDTEMPLKNMRAMSGTVLEALLGTPKAENQGFQGAYSSPLKTAMYVGFQLMAAAKNYWSATRDKVFDEIRKVQDKAYGTTVGVLILKSGFDVFVQSKKSDRNEFRDLQVRENFAFGALSKLPSALIDPIMDMINIMTTISKSILGIYLPLGNGLATVYFLAGAILGVYIPFIPSVIYIFSILAWIFAVIEAMVASPLITIAMAHPDGQEVMGRGEQAIILLVGVFLRPVLSLVGMLVAISFSAIAIELYNDIYLNIMPLYLDVAYSSDLHPSLFVIFFASGFVILYVYALLVILEQCYSLIYMVPDRILRWLGGQADMAGAGVGGALQQISSGLSQDVGGGGQAAGGQSTSGLQQDTSIRR